MAPKKRAAEDSGAEKPAKRSKMEATAPANPKPAKSALDQFSDLVDAKEKKLKLRGITVKGMKLPDCEECDGEGELCKKHEKQLTLDKLLKDVKVIWLKKATLDAMEKFETDMLGEDAEGGFFMTSTSSSYGAMGTIEAALKKADNQLKIGKTADAFNSALAATMNGQRHDYWFRDTDVPETVDGWYSVLVHAFAAHERYDALCQSTPRVHTPLGGTTFTASVRPPPCRPDETYGPGMDRPVEAEQCTTWPTHRSRCP